MVRMKMRINEGDAISMAVLTKFTMQGVLDLEEKDSK